VQQRSGRRAGVALAALAVAVGALVFGQPGVAPAAASEGSVPSVVAAYAADPAGLLARLDDLFGVGVGGKGLDFGDTAKIGELDRVFVWRTAFLSGVAGPNPIKLVNEWTATVTIAGKPVGVATIWINPAGDVPDLADFVQGAALGAAFAGIPATAALVHDTTRSAWFTLEGDALTPIVGGDSGVGSVTTLSAYQGLVADVGTPAPRADPPNSGAMNSIVVVAIAIVAVVGIVLFLGRRSRRLGD
jgi:hypothetical protein